MPKHMRVGVIDMGTNTFHLILVEVTNDDFKIIFREKVAVKIGEKGINKDFITAEAVDRAISCLHQFKEIIDSHQVSEVYATATSAIRNAINGKELIDLIHKETGISARIISGDEEAEYIYYGVKKALALGSEPSLIMDIGGGSIEFIIGNNEKVFWKKSFEVGGQRLVEKFQHADPIEKQMIFDLEEYLLENLAELLTAVKQFQPQTLIGSSGTFDTLSDIYRLKENIKLDPSITEYPLSIDAFLNIHQEILKKNRDERLAIPGMIPLRVDMIVVASVLIRFIIDTLKITNIRVSAYALKEGVLLNTLSTLRKEPTI